MHYNNNIMDIKIEYEIKQRLIKQIICWHISDGRNVSPYHSSNMNTCPYLHLAL